MNDKFPLDHTHLAVTEAIRDGHVRAGDGLYAASLRALATRRWLAAVGTTGRYEPTAQAIAAYVDEPLSDAAMALVATAVAFPSNPVPPRIAACFVARGWARAGTARLAYLLTDAGRAVIAPYAP